MLAIMAGLFQINPIWDYGPYDPAKVSAASQPDWYMGFTEGLLRLFPAWGIYLFGRYTIPPVFWAVVVIPSIMVTLLPAYPALEGSLPRTLPSTTCCSDPATSRSAPRWASWPSPSSW